MTSDKLKGQIEYFVIEDSFTKPCLLWTVFHKKRPDMEDDNFLPTYTEYPDTTFDLITPHAPISAPTKIPTKILVISTPLMHEYCSYDHLWIQNTVICEYFGQIAFVSKLIYTKIKFPEQLESFLFLYLPLFTLFRSIFHVPNKRPLIPIL